jgi:HAD superfamily hydrolase (TIGR01509 family)
MQKEAELRDLLRRARAVIFDFDNVLVDSEPYHYESYSRVFARAGHIIDREEYWLEWTSRGGGAEGEIQRYGLDLDPDEIRRAKDPIYSDFCLSGEIRMFPEARRIIRALGSAGFTLAVASGSYERDIRAILSANGVEDTFSAVVGKDNIERYKPHPETYLRAAREIGTEPAACLAVEDAEKGIKSAKDAGMSVILIETPITRGFDLVGADLTFSNLEELSSCIRGILACGD